MSAIVPVVSPWQEPRGPTEPLFAIKSASKAAARSTTVDRGSAVIDELGREAERLLLCKLVHRVREPDPARSVSEREMFQPCDCLRWQQTADTPSEHGKVSYQAAQYASPSASS